MSNSTHQIAIKAVDKTAPAFTSIQGRAAAAAAKLRGMLGAGIAAAAAYMGLRAIKEGIIELGHLSDIAMKTSTSVDELTSTVTALNVLGIQNMSVEQLAKSFDYMAKTTGRSGMSGFYQTIEEIGKLPDVATRGQEAMRIFGRSGMEFMPLINAADVGTQAISDLVQAMPRIPQAAANAGDAAADAMHIAATGVKSVWLQVLGLVCGWFDNEFTGGIREAAAKSAFYLEYYGQKGANGFISGIKKIIAWQEHFGEVIGARLGAIWEVRHGTGGSMQDAADIYNNAFIESEEKYLEKLDEISRAEAERNERIERAFHDRKIALDHFSKSYSEAAISTKDRTLNGVDLEGIASRSPTIRNELMLGGSNKSLMTAIIGPNLQSETKKQTELLKGIKSAVKENTDAVEGSRANELETI